MPEGFFMEKPKPTPERCSELHDPKLPVVNGGACGNRALDRVVMGPIDSAKPENLEKY